MASTDMLNFTKLAFVILWPHFWADGQTDEQANIKKKKKKKKKTHGGDQSVGHCDC